jgi:hypothetical protein
MSQKIGVATKTKKLQQYRSKSQQNRLKLQQKNKTFSILAPRVEKQMSAPTIKLLKGRVRSNGK